MAVLQQFSMIKAVVAASVMPQTLKESTTLRPVVSAKGAAHDVRTNGRAVAGEWAVQSDDVDRAAVDGVGHALRRAESASGHQRHRGGCANPFGVIDGNQATWSNW